MTWQDWAVAAVGVAHQCRHRHAAGILNAADIVDALVRCVREGTVCVDDA